MEELFSLPMNCGLGKAIISKEAERAISRVLSAKSNCFVQTEINWEGRTPEIRLFGYRKSGIGIEEIQFSPEMVDKKALRLIRNRLSRSLEIIQTVKDYEIVKKAIATVKPGIIRSIDKQNALHVEIMEGPLTGWTGRCNWKAQTPRERNTYRIGQVLQFYVNDIYLVEINGEQKLRVRDNVEETENKKLKGKLAIRIELNRNSSQMAEILLYEALAHFGHSTVGILAKCVQRVPGAKSHFTTSRRVPKEVIALVSAQLKEQVRVQYSTPNG